MRQSHYLAAACALWACSGSEFRSADDLQATETITIDSGAVSQDALFVSPEAASDSAPTAVDVGPCRSDADCPASCPVASMRAVCVGQGGIGAFCACTCDGASAELAGCATICAGVQWSTCSTCDARFYGRSGVCGCSTGSAALCVARTCQRGDECSSGVCFSGWCQP